ncbi:arginine biosynthesis protein ArgJ [Melampsora americana]|nr:arginine biosynthesis protein ArgJ [Melampsora americana]
MTIKAGQTVNSALKKIKLYSPTSSTCSNFPLGYLTSGVHCGIKSIKKTHHLDLGLIISTEPETVAAGCFTRNVFKAAPVQLGIQTLNQSHGQRIRGVVINSGCANAVTGKQGMRDAEKMVEELDALLNRLGPSHTKIKDKQLRNSLVMSTGVIGQLLPMRRVLGGIESSFKTLGNSFEAWLSTAQAFMTTDTFPKLITHTFKSGGKEIRLAGISKGAGMIHPAMSGPPQGTLLGLVATDAAIDAKSLQVALNQAVQRSFNSISVDGDMSTNDTILALANAAAANPLISHLPSNGQSTPPIEFERFVDELTGFTTRLAQLVVRDGEGATKFVKITVRGADNVEDSQRVGSSVARSALVKCALNGEDANWGRILCAVGYAETTAKIDPEKVSVSFIPVGEPEENELKLLVKGEPEIVDEKRAGKILKADDLEILIDLGGDPNMETSYYTCDLSKEYIAINADYRS